MLWIAVVSLGIVVIALARQIGVLHERIAPVGALKIDSGPAVGDKAPALALATLGGGFVQIGQALAKGRRSCCCSCRPIARSAKSSFRSRSRSHGTSG